MKRLGNLGSVRIDPANLAGSLEAVLKAVQREVDYIEDNALAKDDGLASGTFLTTDTPPKTVTIRNGIITSIQ